MASGQIHALSSLISVEVVLYLVYLVFLWTAMPMWAYSTWRHRKSLYVRVRQPIWLLADLALGLGLISLICVKEMSLHVGKTMPCALSNGAAAVGMVWVPGVMLCGNLQLWYASTIMESKRSKVAMLRRFRVLLGGILCLLTLLGVLLATGQRSLCFSSICRGGQGHCYWGTQYTLLIPLSAIGWGATLLAWHLLSSTRRLGRLGLFVGFWQQALVTAPLMGGAFLVTALVDMGVVSPEPYGHCAVSGLWLLTFTSRFVILHMLPSIAYGYMPRCTRRRRGKVLPVQPTTVQSPLLSPTAGMPAGSHHSSHGDIFSRGIDMLRVQPLDGSSPFPIPAPDGAPYQLPAAMSLPDSDESEDSVHSSFAQRFKFVHRASLSLRRPSSSASSTDSSSSHTSGHSAGTPARLSAPYAPLRLSLAAPLASMSLRDILSSGNDMLVAGLLAFCRTLLCDHWVLFLIALHPHCSGSGQEGATPAPMPPEVLQAIYTVFLAPDSPLLAPLHVQLLRGIRQLCRPIGGKRVRKMVKQVSALREKMNPRSITRGFERLVRKLQRKAGPQESGDEESPEDRAAAITRLLELAYEEVDKLVSEEALLMFKSYMSLREATLRDMELNAHRMERQGQDSSSGRPAPRTSTSEQGAELVETATAAEAQGEHKPSFSSGGMGSYGPANSLKKEGGSFSRPTEGQRASEAQQGALPSGLRGFSAYKGSASAQND